ncbi:PEGA domain-containing protein [Acidobacteriia bacterium AH_259_A11_L15]|nr:PEGA domain-containing protein [Acidobacteriia bacterium AH_259_A11_L15]
MRTHRLTVVVAALVILGLAAAPALAQQGTLKVKVKPKTAYTLVDDHPFGQGNRSIRLDPGSHTVSIHRYGHKPHVQQVDIRAGETTELNITLDPVGAPVSGPWGRLRLRVNPEDTAVFLNGTSPQFLVGCTGATDTNFIVKQELLVRPGTHTLTLALEGYQTYTATVEVRANERVELRHTMQPGSGQQTIPSDRWVRKDEDRLRNLNNIQREKTGLASMRAAVVGVTAQLAANPASLRCGDSSRLRWSSEEAQVIEISGLGQVNPSGEQLVQPTQTTTYELRAAGPGGVETATATVNVDASIEASLRASPQTIRYRKLGDRIIEHSTSDLNWSTSNADKVTLDRFGDVNSSGARTVRPEPRQSAEGPVDETLSYTLTASNACGAEVIRTATLRITGSIEPKPEVVLHSVFFPTDYPDQRHPNLGLLGSQRLALTQLAQGFLSYLEYDPDASLWLEAHADERASLDYNRALSERRAAITKQFLVDAGVPAGRIQSDALGEEQPLERSFVQTLEEANPFAPPRRRLRARHGNWLAHNRRVDIVLRPAGDTSLRYFPHAADDSRILWQVPKPARRVVEQNQ